MLWDLFVQWNGSFLFVIMKCTLPSAKCQCPSTHEAVEGFSMLEWYIGLGLYFIASLK
jgi:hypothetical protein